MLRGSLPRLSSRFSLHEKKLPKSNSGKMIITSSGSFQSGSFRLLAVLSVLPAVLFVGCATPRGWLSRGKDNVPVSIENASPRELTVLLQGLSRASAGQQDASMAAIVNRLRGSDGSLTKNAIAKGLAGFESSQAVKILDQLLHDSDANVRATAADSLGTTPSASVQALADALRNDESIDVRLAAARSLGNFKDRESLSALAQAVIDRDVALQHRAMQSLRRVSETDLGDSVQQWQRLALQMSNGDRRLASEQQNPLY